MPPKVNRSQPEQICHSFVTPFKQKFVMGARSEVIRWRRGARSGIKYCRRKCDLSDVLLASGVDSDKFLVRSWKQSCNIRNRCWLAQEVCVCKTWEGYDRPANRQLVSQSVSLSAFITTWRRTEADAVRTCDRNEMNERWRWDGSSDTSLAMIDRHCSSHTSHQ